MHILITGGAGFIGSHLTNFHLRRGDTVEVVDDLSTGARENLLEVPGGEDVGFHHANLLTWRGLDQAVRRADRIYHMAAVVGMFRVLKQPLEVLKVNINATDRLLDAASRSPRSPQVLVPSSSSVYSALPAEDMHEDISLPMCPHAPLLNYALSKLANEVQARAYYDQRGLRVSIVRLFNIVGPRQCALYGFVLPRFVQQALSNSPITVFGDGTQTRSFCDVRDAVAILDTIVGSEKCHGKPINVGNEQEVSIIDLAHRVKEITGSSSPIEFVPYEKAYGQSFEQIPQRRPILDRLHSLTGYRHQWTLDESILGLCDHYSVAMGLRPRLREHRQPSSPRQQSSLELSFPVSATAKAPQAAGVPA